MLVNLVIFFVDDTDYASREQEEKEKERKKEERKQQKLKEIQEKKQKKMELNPPFYKKNRAVKIILDTLVYLMYAAIVIAIIYYGKRWYKNFNEAKIDDGEIHLSHQDVEKHFDGEE